MEVHWLWLVATFFLGTFVGSFGDKASRGFGWGIIATILAFIGLS